MIQFSDIDISKSIETRNLICSKRDWFNILNRIGFALIFIALMINSTTSFLDINFNDPKNRASFLTILLPTFFLFALYGLYRTLMETDLLALRLHLTKLKTVRFFVAF